jgi:GTP-dependent dephospho-CoA kinase
VYVLPVALRERLKAPFAPVEDEATVVAGVQSGRLGRPLIAVGDIVSATLIRHGLAPDVVIYDLGTKRASVSRDVQALLETYEARLMTVESPAAMITTELLTAVRAAIAEAGPVKIHVIGEEDLAALPCILHAPIGGTVIYGMPNRGLVPVQVSERTRSVAAELLSLMKVGPGA